MAWHSCHNLPVTQELLDEFAAEFWRSAGVLTFTGLGLSKLVEQLPETHPDNPDPQIFVGPDAPTVPGARVDASWRRSDLESAARKDGWLREWLTDAWIALIFARWEGHYRPAFAATHGIEPSRVNSVVVGDIRLMRNDVIHHRGIATAKNTGKCKIITRLRPGDRIILTPEDIRALHAVLDVTLNPPES